MFERSPVGRNIAIKQYTPLAEGRADDLFFSREGSLLGRPQYLAGEDAHIRDLHLHVLADDEHLERHRLQSFDRVTCTFVRLAIHAT